MFNLRLSWKFTIFLILITLANGPFILYLMYKQKGYLPKGAILIVVIVTIFICSVMLIFELLFQYIMKYENKNKKDDEQ